MIRRITAAAFLTLCLAALGLQQPRAQFNGCMAGFCAPAVVGGGANPTWTGTAAAVNQSCGFVTPCTIAGGMNVTTGFVVAIVGGNSGSNTSITAVNICGTSLSLVKDSGSGAATTQVGLYAATVTGGVGCTVSITFSTTIDKIGVALGTLNNLNSTTPGTTCGAFYAASQNSPYLCTGGLTVLASGFGIAGIWTFSNAAVGSGNMTVDATASGAANISVGIGHATTSNTPSMTGLNFTTAGVVGASWR
jgi:hypothetical protein